jgi:hypothetical protein
MIIDRSRFSPEHAGDGVFRSGTGEYVERELNHSVTLDSSRVRRPVPAGNDWGTSASRAIRYCTTCSEEPRGRLPPA